MSVGMMIYTYKSLRYAYRALHGEKHTVYGFEIVDTADHDKQIAVYVPAAGQDITTAFDAAQHDAAAMNAIDQYKRELDHRLQQSGCSVH